jgi:hypothetical protein
MTPRTKCSPSIPAQPHPLKNTGDFKGDEKFVPGLKPRLWLFSLASKMHRIRLPCQEELSRSDANDNTRHVTPTARLDGGSDVRLGRSLALPRATSPGPPSTSSVTVAQQYPSADADGSPCLAEKNSARQEPRPPKGNVAPLTTNNASTLPNITPIRVIRGSIPSHATLHFSVFSMSFRGKKHGLRGVRV